MEKSAGEGFPQKSVHKYVRTMESVSVNLLCFWAHLVNITTPANDGHHLILQY